MKQVFTSLYIWFLLMALLVYVPRLNWYPGLQGVSSRHYPWCNDPKGSYGSM
jgi:hypothetical protein